MVTPSGVVVLTDRRIAAGPLAEVVAAAVAGGTGWVVLRERDLRYAERQALAASLRAVVPPGRLIVAGPDPLGGDAVHLAAADPMPSVPLRTSSRSAPVEHERGYPSPKTTLVFHWSAPVEHQRGAVRMVGRSCHDAEEVAAASEVDYVTLSPIFPTATKPGYGPALTPDGAARLAPPVPWLALGGVDSAERARQCAAAGAAGVAVLGAVMRAADPERVTRELAAAFAGAGVRA